MIRKFARALGLLLTAAVSFGCSSITNRFAFHPQRGGKRGNADGSQIARG
ncbi:MAG: hypothetical protein AAF517_01410 [Planctomycetota bacterium]